MTILSVDAMSGDYGLDIIFPAAVDIVQQHRDVKLILVGDESKIESKFNNLHSSVKSRLSIYPTSDIIEMTDSPAYALRNKKNSSMRVAIDLVKKGQADACVSAGNTGALVATARFVLKRIPGIERPAICTSLPRANGYTYMLDLGANINSSPKILYQFGLMGVLLIQCIRGKENPSVGLLNIGSENIKGDETIKQASELFKNSGLNYIGFVEADEIYIGNTDLIVCDGFVGNVALKASEGVAQMIMSIAKKEFTQTWLAKSRALVSRPVLKTIKRRLDHRRYNGASVLGFRGLLVKSHGGADKVAFKHAIEVAMKEEKKNLVYLIENALSSWPS